MADFSFITARLATGAAITGPDDVTQLTAAGITHIIDCRAEADDAPLLAGSGLAYLWNPTADDGQHPKPVAWFAAGLTFALPALAQPRTRVYAHCAAGVNRGPSMAGTIIMAGLGLPEPQVRLLLAAARPQAQAVYLDDGAAAAAALGY